MKKTIIMAMVIALTLGFMGCSKTPSTTDNEGKTIDVVDMLGNKVSFEKPCEKIVSLSPADTELLFELGVGDKVVGVTEYCNYPEEALTKQKIGDFSNPNIELIKELLPDVIITRGALQEGFNGLDMKTIATEDRDFEGIYENIRLLAKVTGTVDKGEEIIKDMMAQLAKLEEANKAIDKKPRVFYVVWDDPLMTAGGDVFISDVIKAAGAENVAQSLAGWAMYSTEQLLVDEIDYIIFAKHSRAEEVTKETIQAHPIYSKLKCVENGNIHIMSDDDIIARAVPRVLQGIKEINETINK